MGHRRISNKRVKQMMSDIYPDDFNNQEDVLVESNQEKANELPNDNEE
jgi:hypothetical protein